MLAAGCVELSGKSVHALKNRMQRLESGVGQERTGRDALAARDAETARPIEPTAEDAEDAPGTTETSMTKEQKDAAEVAKIVQAWDTDKARDAEGHYSRRDRRTAGMKTLVLRTGTDLADHQRSWVQVVNSTKRQGQDAYRRQPRADSWAGILRVNWQLEKCSGTDAEGRERRWLACNFKRARRKLAKDCEKKMREAGREISKEAINEEVRTRKLSPFERDELGLVFYGADTLPTVLASYTNRIYIGAVSYTHLTLPTIYSV